MKLNRSPCPHGHYPSVPSNPCWGCFCKLKKWVFCRSLESTWHCLALFVTALFSVCRNEEWVPINLNVKTEIQMSRPFHITGCFEFWAQFVQATMLGRTTWLCLHLLIKGYSRHNRPRLQANGLLMPYKHRLLIKLKRIEFEITLWVLRIFPVREILKVAQLKAIMLYIFYFLLCCCLHLGWN